MNNTLSDVRNTWESQLNLVSHVDLTDSDICGCAFSVLESDRGYTVMRYFIIGDKWVASKDVGPIPVNELIDHIFQVMK